MDKLKATAKAFWNGIDVGSRVAIVVLVAVVLLGSV